MPSQATTAPASKGEKGRVCAPGFDQRTHESVQPTEEENMQHLCQEHIGQPLLEWPKGVKRSQ